MVFDIILSSVCLLFASMTVFFNRRMLSSVSLIMFFLTVSLIVFKVGSPFVGFVFLALSVSSIAMFSICIFLMMKHSYQSIAVQHSTAIRISGIAAIVLLCSSFVMVFYKSEGIVNMVQTKGFDLSRFLSALLAENMVPFLFLFLFLFVVLFATVAIIKSLRDKSGEIVT